MLRIDGPSREEAEPATLLRSESLGMHSPRVLSNGHLAVGNNGGVVQVFAPNGPQVPLDTGMTSGPILAIAELEPLVFGEKGSNRISNV